MVIDHNQYLWSKVPLAEVVLEAAEQQVDFEAPTRIYRIEGEATLSLYEDAEKTNLLFEGPLPTEFTEPLACTGLYVVSDAIVTLTLVCETGILKADLSPYMGKTAGMTTLHSGNDDNTYSISCNLGFKYNGVTVNTLYVSSNSWFGFGSSTEHLKIMRRDCYASYIYYQTGNLREGLDFLKVRYSGYTVYNNKVTANRLIYELFLLSNNDMFLNLIQTPTSSYTGTSELVCGTTTSLSLIDSTGTGAGKHVTFVPGATGGKSWSVEYRLYQEPNIDTESYLLRLEDTYYTLVDGVLTPAEVEELTPAMFMKYGFETMPTTELLTTLPNPHMYYWRSDGERQQFRATVTAEPFPQVLTATADLSHASIVGITEMTAQFSGSVMVQHSVDNGASFSEEVLLSDFLNTDLVALWESVQETKRIDFRFTLYAEATLTSFRIHYTN